MDMFFCLDNFYLLAGENGESSLEGVFVDATAEVLMDYDTLVRECGTENDGVGENADC